MSAAGAIAAAKAAAAAAASAAAKAGVPFREQQPVIEESSALAAARKQILAKHPAGEERRRALNELWIGSSLGFVRAVSDPTRLRIIHMLRRAKRMDVGSIAKALGLKQSSTSQQLGKLRAAKILISEREKQTVHYMLNRHYLAWKSQQVLKGLQE